MGTDMHVAIEVRRKEYDYPSKAPVFKWKFIKKWTVDRCYDLFGCFGTHRRSWSNALHLTSAVEMSRELQGEMADYCYGFYAVSPQTLKEKILGWTPPKDEWKEENSYADNEVPPVIDKEWFFDFPIYMGNDEEWYDDNVNYAIYKLMLRKYGKNNVRLIVYFDS